MLAGVGLGAPAKVLVIGSGVAGLSAVGAARSLGAIVRMFDPCLEAQTGDDDTLDAETVSCSAAVRAAERELFLHHLKVGVNVD